MYVGVPMSLAEELVSKINSLIRSIERNDPEVPFSGRVL